MKIRELTTNKVFNPIKLEITIESKAELLSLLSRTYLSSENINQQYTPFTCDRETPELYHILHNAAKDRSCI